MAFQYKLSPLPTEEERQHHLKTVLGWTVLTLCYLAVEWVYNQHLLSIMSLEHISAEQFNRTEIFGKCIASVGLNFVLKKLRPSTGWFTLLLGMIAGYFALGVLFNTAINAFPDEFRHSSYYSVLYRNEVLKNKDPSKITDLPTDAAWYEKPLLMSHFVLTLSDKQWEKHEKITKNKVNKETASLLKNSEKHWKDYQKTEQGRIALEKGWNNYQNAMNKYNQYKASIYRGRATAEFKKRVGLPPELTQIDFYAIKAPDYSKYLMTRFFEGNSDAGLQPIYGKDIPHGMNQNDFINYLKHTASNIQEELAPDVKDIRDNHLASDSVAVLVVPPISIALSLLSIGLNIILLAYTWLELWIDHYIKPIQYGIKIVYVLVTLSIAITMVNARVNPNTRLDYWSHAHATFAQHYPLLDKVDTFALKAEPIICITQNEADIVKVFTASLYAPQGQHMRPIQDYLAHTYTDYNKHP